MALPKEINGIVQRWSRHLGRWRACVPGGWCGQGQGDLGSVGGKGLALERDWTRSGLGKLELSVSKVLLEHSHTYSFLYILQWFLYYSIRAELCNRSHAACSVLTYLLYGS